MRVYTKRFLALFMAAVLSMSPVTAVFAEDDPDSTMYQSGEEPEDIMEEVEPATYSVSMVDEVGRDFSSVFVDWVDVDEGKTFGYQADVEITEDNIPYIYDEEYNKFFTFLGYASAPDGEVVIDCVNKTGMIRVEANTTLYACWAVHTVTVTVKFNANGGTGSMEALQFEKAYDGRLSTSAKLTSNTFKRSGYSFKNWNTVKGGSGDSFKNGADIKSYLQDTDKTTVTLYAQWKADPVKLKALKKKGKEKLAASWSKISSASGYQLQQSTKKNFSGAVSTLVSKKNTSYTFENMSPGKTIYVRVRSYRKSGGSKKYDAWSNVKSVKTKKYMNIATAPGRYVISSDIKVTGSGTGYHAKLRISNAASACSFGIQYDTATTPDHAGKPMVMVENVRHNGAGGQSYYWPKNIVLKKNKAYNMMMSVSKNGVVSIYLNHKKIGSYKNSNLKGTLSLCVEGACRLNGDSIKASFSNIKIRKGSSYNPFAKGMEMRAYNNNRTMKAKKKGYDKVLISGKVTGLSAGQNWDNAYNSVQAVMEMLFPR